MVKCSEVKKIEKTMKFKLNFCPDFSILCVIVSAFHKLTSIYSSMFFGEREKEKAL